MGSRPWPAARSGLALWLPLVLAWSVNGGARGQEAPALTPPELLEAPEITLPDGIEPLPEDASIELLLTVAADGTVQEARVLEPLRDDVDALVLEAAQAMRFRPATRGGEPIPARIRFRYRIPPPPPPPSSEGDDVGDEDLDEENEDATGPEPSTATPGEAISEVETGGDLRPLGIEARVQRVEPGAVSRITLRGEELTTVPGTFGEPLRVVATLPGVVRSPFGLGFFLVRGANFQNTGFFVDGFQVPLLYHLGAGPAVLSSRLVSQIDFYPGGYPAMFGRFSAGIVSVETAPPPTDRIRGELEVDLFRASALLVVPFDGGRGSVAAAFRRSYFELLLPFVAPGVNLAYTDYQLRADYRVDSRMQLSLFFFGSDDVLDQTGGLGGGVASEGSQTAFGYEFQRLIARMNLRLPGNARVSIAGSLGRAGNFFSAAQPGSAPLQVSVLNGNAAFRADAQLPWGELSELQTNFGLDISATTFDVTATAFVPPGLGEYPRPIFTPQASDVDRMVVRALAAAYIEQVIRLGPVQISGATRFEYQRYGDVSELVPDPRLVVRWQVVPELLLKGATGLFSQPPSPFQLARDGGNPTLRPERAWQNSVGAELTLPERVEVHSTFFYNEFYDLVRQANRVIDTPTGPRRVFFHNDGEGRAYGLELLVRRRVEQGFYGWLSYTLSRSERLQNGVWQPFTFDQTHVLNLAASYAIDGWRFGAALQLATGRPNRTVVGTTFDADSDNILPTFRDIGDRVPLFHRLDVRVDRDFDLGFMTGSVYLDIQNVYNAPNAEGVLYSFDYSQSAPLPGLPILPTIGVRGILR